MRIRIVLHCAQLILVLGACAPTAHAQAQVSFGDDSSQWARDGECDDPRFQGEGSAETLLDEDRGHDATDCRALFKQRRIALAANPGTTANSAADGTRVERGWLESSDGTLTSGEYADLYSFEGAHGRRAVVDLRSGEFDPYLMVRTPDGKQFDNDDYDGDAGRSLLSLDLQQSGTYQVTVTSYRKGETGGYTVAITLEADDQPFRPIDRRGTLQVGDDTLESGEYVDSYEFDGSPGQHVTVDLASDDFDTYVILIDPNGEQTENDDAEDSDGVGHSIIEADLTETGTHRVLVTSYESGETGAYRLMIDSTQASSTDDAPANRDVTTLTVGRPSSGRLESGDQELQTGEFQDIYVFDGTAGQNVRVELESSDFDTYVGLITPNEEAIENDDVDGSTDRSVVELTLRESGRYRVVATSYAAAETGAYRLMLNTDGARLPAARSSTGRIYGMFAGISDYPGEEGDLSYTAEDATRMHDALVRGAGMRSEDAYTLLDAQATTQSMRGAIDAIAARIRPEDTFVLFFSGHGNRVDQDGAPESFDPDGLDETIELYDGPIRDDELRDMLDQISARTTLILLDSCFSGGFAKDIISVPGRMGMFSSEEDVTSQVASKFRAGGFLSVFLDEGIAESLADEDGNGAVTALELSQYVHERYRSDVKGPSSEYVRTQGPQSGYQHLVIDRGSVGPFDVLFER